MKLDQYLQVETLSLVIIGKFNPAIIQPSWLSSKKLIRDEESVNAKIDIIHNEICRFELDWLTIEVTRERFELKSSKVPYFDPLKDLVMGIFSILKETPIASIGINHVYEISLPNKNAYYDFGCKLTPLSIWENDINDPRLLQLEIHEKERKGVPFASRRIRIVPSLNQAISFGITIDVNNHFDLSKINVSDSFFTTIEGNWDSSLKETRSVVNNFLVQVLA